jgi:ankyrin repeat protein
MRHEEAECLLKGGANPNNNNIESTYGTTLLNIAVQNGDITSVANLLKHGVDVNLRDDMERTVLHYSVIYNYPEMRQFLLENGADSTATDYDGRTYDYYSFLNNHLTNSNSDVFFDLVAGEGAKANTSDGKPTASPSTNPTNPKKEGQLVTENQATKKMSFSEI